MTIHIEPTKAFVEPSVVVSAQPPQPAILTVKTIKSLPVDEACQRLVELQSRRCFCIKQQQRCDRSIESLLARSFGFTVDLTAEERKKLYAQAAKLRDDIEKGRRTHELAGFVLASEKARATWDDMRADLEKEMIALAKLLPAVEFVAAVRGFGQLGLAAIVGEAGNLSNYANPAKLWKRMGLAVLDGRRQGSPGENATAEDWQKHGYNPRRRSQIWSFCSDSMFRAQWRGERDDVPAHAIGPYGEVYAERKKWMLARGLTPRHADNDAKRIMTKRLLLDLWRAWRDANAPLSLRGDVHPADA